MNYKLSEILDSIDFYGSTLSKTAWYPSNALRKEKNAKELTMPKRGRKRQKTGGSF